MTEQQTIWRFFDDRTGHRNQVLGLTDTLADLCAVDVHDIAVNDGLRGWRCLVPGRINRLRSLPAPDLLIGAGHATHLPLLAARRRFGGRAIVLMKPSLPLSWFDLCLIPKADELRRVPTNVILTEGALNRVRPVASRAGDAPPEPSVAMQSGSAVLARREPSRLNHGAQSHRGLILIGGPSDHFHWDDHRVLDQIAAVVAGSPEITWTLTTSRRTPPSFPAEWTRRGIPGCMIPVEQTSPDWLPAQLQSSDTVWVTTDSVSMIYEALTSGAAVGLLQLSSRSSSRVTRGMESLTERGLVTAFDKWSRSGELPRTSQPLHESRRCAALVVEKLMKEISTISRAHREAA